jgi:hypothetical protein
LAIRVKRRLDPTCKKPPFKEWRFKERERRVTSHEEEGYLS